MASYQLQIISPAGVQFDGPADYLMLRTAAGDLGILHGHVPMTISLGTGPCYVRVGDEVRHAMCDGGLLYVSKEVTRVLPQLFEWAEDIDVERATTVRDQAQAQLEEMRANGQGTGPAANVVKARIERNAARIRAAQK